LALALMLSSPSAHAEDSPPIRMIDAPLTMGRASANSTVSVETPGVEQPRIASVRRGAFAGAAVGTVFAYALWVGDRTGPDSDARHHDIGMSVFPDVALVGAGIGALAGLVFGDSGDQKQAPADERSLRWMVSGDGMAVALSW
jgi:hypothetical protein